MSDKNVKEYEALMKEITELAWGKFVEDFRKNTWYKFNPLEKSLFVSGFQIGWFLYYKINIKKEFVVMSKPSRGQKCKCGHPRMKHNLNAGKCNEDCECMQFKAVKHKQIRLKDTNKKESVKK